jgi:thiol-disulfide isomerase/thioredoxin
MEVKSLITLIVVLFLSSIYGIWFRKTRGTVKAHTNPAVTEAEIGESFGERLTLLQFSSAFCTPCRATRVLLSDITKGLSDVKHVDIDAESHLELVRKLDIRSTPTTLILNAQGVEIGRAVGAPKREQVVDAIAPMDI